MVLKVSTLPSEKGWFYQGKTKDLSGGTIPGPGGSPTGSRRGFWRFSGNFGFEKGSFYRGKMKDLARIVGQVLQN